MIENAGEDRQIAVQIFIDYIQVPMIIEGETYQTFFVDTDKSFSKEFCFQIAETLELGKMRDEGLLAFHKSHFLLKTPEAEEAATVCGDWQDSVSSYNLI